jgi:hypothetical protein
MHASGMTRKCSDNPATVLSMSDAHLCSAISVSTLHVHYRLLIIACLLYRDPGGSRQNLHAEYRRSRAVRGGRDTKRFCRERLSPPKNPRVRGRFCVFWAMKAFIVHKNPHGYIRLHCTINNACRTASVSDTEGIFQRVQPWPLSISRFVSHTVAPTVITHLSNNSQFSFCKF